MNKYRMYPQDSSSQSNLYFDQILATPAIVDGKIYVRTEGYLYAFGR